MLVAILRLGMVWLAVIMLLLSYAFTLWEAKQ